MTVRAAECEALSLLATDDLRSLDHYWKSIQNKFFGCGISGDFADQMFSQAQRNRENIWVVLRARGLTAPERA